MYIINTRTKSMFSGGAFRYPSIGQQVNFGLAPRRRMRSSFRNIMVILNKQSYLPFFHHALSPSISGRHTPTLPCIYTVNTKFLTCRPVDLLTSRSTGVDNDDQ